METAEIIAFSAGLVGVLVGVSLATIAIIWQIRSQSSRVDSLSGRVDALSGRFDGLSVRIDGLNDKIDAMGERLSAEIRAQGAELTETRLEQARLEGANRMQSDRTDRVEALSEELRYRMENVESNQARFEGVNESLARILERQSHTHPPHNPPIDQEAAAD